MRPTEIIVEAENVPHKIFYKIGHFQISLFLPISLKIIKWV